MQGCQKGAATVLRWLLGVSETPTCQFAFLQDLTQCQVAFLKDLTQCQVAFF